MKIKLLLFGALALVGLSAFGAKRSFDYADILPQLQTALTGIRRASLNANGIKIVIDVLVRNPTDKALNFASAGAVIIRKLFIYDRNGVLAATAEPNIYALSIPARGQVILKNIPLTTEYGNLIGVIFGGGVSMNPDDYTVEAELDALGGTVTV